MIHEILNRNLLFVEFHNLTEHAAIYELLGLPPKDERMLQIGCGAVWILRPNILVTVSLSEIVTRISASRKESLLINFQELEFMLSQEFEIQLLY